MWKLHKNTTTRLFVTRYKWKRIDGMKNVFLMQNVLGTRSVSEFNCLQYFFLFFFMVFDLFAFFYLFSCFCSCI